MLVEKGKEVGGIFEEGGKYLMSIKYILNLMLSIFYINCFF